MIGYYDCIFRKVEKAACRSASIVTGRKLDAEEIYSGKTKTMLHISIARSLAFLVMHDSYGIKYAAIAERAGMSEKAVMKSCAKARIYRFLDSTYKKTYESIMNMI